MSAALKYKQSKPSMLQKSQFMLGLAEISLSTNIHIIYYTERAQQAKPKWNHQQDLLQSKRETKPFIHRRYFHWLFLRNKKIKK